MSPSDETNRLLTEIRDLLAGQKEKYAEYLAQSAENEVASQQRYRESLQESEQRTYERYAQLYADHRAKYQQSGWKKQLAWMAWASVVIAVLYLASN